MIIKNIFLAPEGDIGSGSGGADVSIPDNTATPNIDNTEPMAEPETNQAPEQTEEGEKKPFNVEDMEFDDEEFEEKPNYSFGDYNLEKYKDRINFKDDNVVNAFNKMASEYKEKGFTQEQIEFLIDREIESKENSRITDEQIKEDLKARLKPEVKRNWKNLTGEVSKILESSGMAEHSKAFMSNPVLMNMAYAFLNANKPGNSNSLRQRDESRGSKTSYTADRAGELLGEALKTKNFGSHADLKSFANDLLSKVKSDEKEKALIYLGSYIK